MKLPFQRPRPAPLSEVAVYYEASERARHYSNGGPCVRLLSERIADRLGGGVHVVPVANATIGLEVALALEARQPRPVRVVMPSFSFPATPLSATRLGHHPVFVDIGADDWQADVDGVIGAIDNEQPTVMMGCTTFGTPPSAAYNKRLGDACRRAGVPLIVDAAASLGGLDAGGGWYVNRFGPTVLSLHVTKTAATSEGGLVVVGDADQALTLQRLINFGFDADRQAASRDATNGKMSEIAAAFALAMLDGLELSLARRRELVARARIEFPADLQWQAGVERSTAQFISVAVPPGMSRDAVSAALTERGVEHRMNFPPLHRQPAFAGDEVRGALDVTDDLGRRVLSLPMYSDMTDEEMSWLIESVAVPLSA
jgi:dTDP-4-amino-4,6-dideoxygalactose transaminase